MAVPKRPSLTHSFKFIYLISLVLLTNISYILSFFIVFQELRERNFYAYVLLTPFISLSSFLLADFLKMPRFFRKKNIELVAQSIRFAFMQTLFTVGFIYVLTPEFPGYDTPDLRNAFPRSVLLVSCPLIWLLTNIWSAIGMQISNLLYGRGQLIIVGSSTEEINAVGEKIQGSLSDFDMVLAGKMVCTEQTHLETAMAPFSEILVCPNLSDKLKTDIIHYCATKDIVSYLIPEFYEIAMYESKIIHIDDLMVFMIDRMRLTFEQRIVKRLFDVIVSILALIFFSPFILVSVIVIKITSPGSAFFRQERVTLNNKKFEIYKLRTMLENAEEDTGPVISGKDDPRVTRFGKFLRRSKIDEIPQFLNVLKGDMSVVGPRSERPEFIDQFEKDIPSYSQRLSVKAGITGLAQVAGSYDTTPEDKLRYDLLYIKNYTLLQDIKIIIQTIRTIFTPKLYHHTFEENQEENRKAQKRQRKRKKKQKNR